MMRGMQKVCGHNKTFFLEPYACSLQVLSHYTSAAANATQLPRQPVPKLSDTLQKLLTTIKPHVNNEQFAITTKLVRDFENGVGAKLQSSLVKRAAEHVNWLEDWWLNAAYLAIRDSVVVSSSPGLVFPFLKFKDQSDQLRHAAKTLMAAIEYKTIIDTGKLPVQMSGKNPLDMGQFLKIFGTCRIPGEKRDRLSFNRDSKHVTVIHNNDIFHVALWGDDNVMLSEDQIYDQLKEVIDLSPTSNNNMVGILTSENRDAWSKAYQLMIKDAENKKSLEDVEKSVIVLCLDSAVGLWNLPKKDAQQNLAAAQTIHGGGSQSNGGNRWFDKTVQLIVGADGLTGLTYEHSPAEGQPIAIFTDFLVKFMEKNKTSENAPSRKPRPPQKLKFNLTPEISRMIQTAQKNLDRLADDLELNCFTFERYGKNFCKSQKISPDSYIQMAMQYAFYRLHGTPAAHYESAATRMYEGGRTETIRSCSLESVHFARTMLDIKSTPKAKRDAMMAAINAHKDYALQASRGFGVDRHMLGLKLTAIENGIEIHPLYSDPGYVKSSHMRLSTSQVACKCDGFMCYGPLVSDGYATCYNPRDDSINFATSCSVSNKETNCTRYRAALEQSLMDMHDVLIQNTKSKL